MAPKKWTIATARQHFPALVGSAAREPQRVYRREKLVAAVVSPETADRLASEQRPRLADALHDLKTMCAEDNYELPAAARRDRPNRMRRR